MKDKKNIQISMAFLSRMFLLLLLLLLFITITMSSISFPTIFSATVVEDLNNLHPPKDFNTTITKNCHANPLLRYCNSTTFNLQEIFKSTIVASHLCNISNNTNCQESFDKIDLHGQPKTAPLYLSFTFFWKYCPLTILSINISNSSLKGNFPIDIFQCSQIKSLDLSYNNLSGDVPIENFSLLGNLTFLNMSYNKFSESKISDKHFFERFNYSCFIQSGIIPDHREFKIKAVLLLVGFPLFVILMVIFLGWICFWRPDCLPKFLQRKHKFTYSILKAATDGFSEGNLLKETRKVCIYKGVLRDGTDVRIKIYLDNISRENRRKFVEEGKVLVQLSQENIVPVLGFCDNRKFRAIVYESRDGENVETWLENCVPSWKQRVKVILGIAAGICYLHEEWPEVGYDLKKRNLLISDDGEPFITKFKIDHHHSSSNKTYKFGMFVLEMVTNRRPVKNSESEEAGFIEWVNLNHIVNLENVIDKRMKRNENIIRQASEVIGFGLMCTDLSSRRKANWDTIFDLVTNFASVGTSASPDDHKRSRVRSKGNKHSYLR